MQEITAQVLLRAYAVGMFPMANDATSRELYWFDPLERGILPLERFHVPRSLRKTVRRRVFEIRVDTAFREVVRRCAEPAPGRDKTWINDRIVELYCTLFAMGRAHSVEAWRDDGLVGGLYGVALGGAFFGESMFSREPDASKVALVSLVARLRAGGFALLDTQFVTEHLRQFGAVEIPRREYRRRLERAIQLPARFPLGPDDELVEALLQSTTQTS